MPRSARRASTRLGYRDRHGRGLRSAVTGPHLPMLRTRIDFFDTCVASALEYLRSLWPEELSGVRIDVASFPPGEQGPDGVDRWRTDPRTRRVVLYRVPIQRLAILHRDDDWHRRDCDKPPVTRDQRHDQGDECTEHEEGREGSKDNECGATEGQKVPDDSQRSNDA